MMTAQEKMLQNMLLALFQEGLSLATFGYLKKLTDPASSIALIELSLLLCRTQSLVSF